MTEADLTQDLMKFAHADMRGSVTLKHAEKFTTGIPDFSHTWRKMTSWWEVKFWNNGSFDAPKLQHLTCRRLAAAGTCHYIIYEQREDKQRVVIVHPDQLDQWQESQNTAFGFNHFWVCKFMRQLHRTVNV